MKMLMNKKAAKKSKKAKVNTPPRIQRTSRPPDVSVTLLAQSGHA
jgi:hypothetical protein